MNSLILFVNAFLSYLLLFIFIVVLVIIACVIGAKWRISKDKKLAAAGGDNIVESVSNDEK
ncbi:MAG: hypothetical protein K2N85_02985 [Lachnospiraceae bacterium]|nr:hypothetical protein [Lachnospiraceae bacterium]